MKRWVVILFVLLAAAYTCAAAKTDTAEFAHVEVSLSERAADDPATADTPLFATAPFARETMRTGGSGCSIGKAPGFSITAGDPRHHIFHSHTLCGDPDRSPGTFTRAADHFVFEFRRIVI